MTRNEFMAELEKIYPSQMSCEWDNDGFMCAGDFDRPVKKVMVSLDATRAAIQAAADKGCDLLLTHHPMIFRPTRSVLPDSLVGDRVTEALRRDVAVISLHTRLDAGEQGVNDLLAQKLNLVHIRPFGTPDAPTMGRIGEVALYSSLAYDYFFPIVKVALHAPYLATAGERRVYRVAVVGGAGGDFAEEALRLGADTLVTGEMKYNAMEDMAERGLNIILAGHYFTEAPVVDRLAELAKTIAGVQVEYFMSNPVTIRT